ADLGVDAQVRRDLRQELLRAGAELVAVELDGQKDVDAIVAHDDLRRAAIRAAVVVLDAVDRLGLIRALVDEVGDAVAVVVQVRAAVGVLVAVEVLRLVGALVALVGDAVAVVVRLGTAVRVLEAVLVLGHVGAVVAVVGDAVAVVVRLGAAVRVLK